ncbi:MAG: DAK2 domain-containing protein [Clostridia bacterium]|nr:DAK2 domain-containing protein [Clostridia bacterium]
MEARLKTNIIDGELYASMIRSGAVNLHANRQIVNDLNVFPIPDGDTGDNMYMTIDSGAQAIHSDEYADLGAVAQAVAKGMLLGARGNSGVILSRIFSGIARGLQGSRTCDLKTLCHAFELGVDEAYRAVSVPVEGTILTVYKDAVRYAAEKLSGSSSAQSYFYDFTQELKRSLDRTPELLAVLKESGVVDSGGAGFIYIAEGMRRAVEGDAFEGAGEPQAAQKIVDVSRFTEDSVLDFGYCTEFLLRLQRAKTDIDSFDLPAFIDYLNSVGESVVAFRDGSIVKAHVHTMHPGQVLEYCQNYGEFLTLKIENMTLQHNESKVENRFSAPAPKPHKRYGIVSVAAGDGIKTTFYSLGVDWVIEGGQSMNPSAEDFVRAFREINADTILVFPNNGNVILTAKHAAELYDRAEIRIIPTKTVGEGYAAISMLDTSSGDTEQIIAEQREIIENVVTGAVSKASRNATMNGVNVVLGDYISFVGDDVYADEKTANAAAVALADKLGAGNYDIMLILCGRDTADGQRQALEAELKQRFRRTEVILIDGGQPIYDYIIVFE